MKRKFLLVAVSLIFVFAWSQESSAPEVIESILSESENSQSKISSPDEIVSEEDSQNNETEIPNVFLPENEIPEIKDEPKQETYDAISGSQPSENIKFKYAKTLHTSS